MLQKLESCTGETQPIETSKPATLLMSGPSLSRWCRNPSRDMAEPRPAQPFEALARKGAELVVMMQEQAMFHCQLERLWAQSEHQTKVGLVPPPPLVSLSCMGEGDDRHTFLEVFQAMEVACCYPEEEWALRLLRLLSGEAQAVALSLPTTVKSSLCLAAGCGPLRPRAVGLSLVFPGRTDGAGEPAFRLR